MAKANNRMIAPTAKTPTQILLERLIDYAGLFPPASLGMLSAVHNYGKYIESPHSKMLGRFIVPAAQLPEFEDALASVPPCAIRWELSVLVGADIGADIKWLGKKHARYGIKSIEVKAANAEDVRHISAIIPPDIETYIEVPLSGEEKACIDAIAKYGRRAKIRTGGETPDKFPACEKIAAFLYLCTQVKIAFKATAGLHHPCRSVHHLTYKDDSPTGVMHGFLNVFLAAAFIYAGMKTKAAKELLEEQSPEAFRFDRQHIIWRDYRLDIATLAKVRKNFAISFGSCSFTEPVDDLSHLGLL